MIAKLRHLSQRLRTSFWFVPALIVLSAVGLATGLIAVDANLKLQVAEQWPLVFGAGADGSRGLLTAVASSMITVAGVVFSVTIVALSLTSSQYTSRVLRNFMRDGTNQAVLGVFVGIFAYCLVVLRTIRGGDEGAFVPSLAVLGGLALAFIGIGFLIYFIHHISLSIQASSIIAAAAAETVAAVDHLFPDELGSDADEDTEADLGPDLAAETWTPVAGRCTGYVESVDGDTLLHLARKYETVLRMERGVGDFVIQGTPLVSVARRGKADELTEAEVNDGFVISRHRTVQQDAGFGIRQIVDVAMKALSPGVNDTTTAVVCVDYLGAILARMAMRGIAPAHRVHEGRLCVIARGASFETLLGEAFDQLRHSAEGNFAVLTRQLQTLEAIAGRTTNSRRRRLLRKQANLTIAVAQRTIPSQHDAAGPRAAWVRLARVLDE